MAINVSEIMMKVKMDTSEGVSKLGMLEDAYNKLQKAYKATKSDVEKKSIYDDLGFVNDKIKKEREELGLYGLSLKQLKTLQREYAAEWQTTFTQGSEEWRKARENYDKVSARINSISSGVAELRKQYEEFGAASLTVQELERVSKSFYSTILQGSEAGKVEQHALYSEYVKIEGILKDSKEALNTVALAEKNYKTQLKETVDSLGLSALSLKQQKEYYKLLQEEIETTINLDSEHSKQLIANANKVKSQIDSTETKLNGKSSMMQRMMGGLSSAVVGGLAGGVAALGLDSLEEAFSTAIKKGSELADMQSELTISLGLTDTEVNNLVDSLENIDTRTSVEGLKELALVAGDLNETDVAGFVEGMDKAYIAFEKDFSSSAELADSFGKLKGLFPEGRNEPTVKFVEGYGSAIAKLKDDGPATTKGILEFASRIGQLPDALKPAMAETLALAAVFEEADLKAEVSAGGLSNVLLVAGQNSALFAKQLGLSTKEVKTLISTSPNEFLIKLAESFKGASATDLDEKLKNLKIGSQESIKVIGILSDNVQKLRDKQALSNNAVQEGTRLTEVFNEKNNNAAANLAKAGKTFEGWGNTLANVTLTAIMPVVKAIGSLGEKAKSASDLFQEQTTRAAQVTTKLNTLVTRYKELSSTQNLSATAQRELNGVMSEIGTIVPQAITKYDSFGRAMKINLGLVNDFLDKQKKVTENLKNESITESVTKIEELSKKSIALKERLSTLINPNYPSAQLIYAGEIKNISKELEGLRIKISEERRKVRALNTDVDISNSPTTPTKKELPKTTLDNSVTSDKDLEKAAREAEQKRKFLQESTQKEIELKARLIHEADIASANEENRKILEAEYKAEQEITKINQQYTDKNGIVLKANQLSLQQKKVIADEEKGVEESLVKEVLAIRSDFAEKRALQLQEQVAKTLEISQKGAITELQAQLAVLTNKGDIEGAYVIQRRLVSEQAILAENEAEQRFTAEKEKLKGNNEAIAVLQKNYDTEKIQAKKATDNQLELLELEHSKKMIDRKSQSDIEAKKLAISEAEKKGGDALTEKLALIQSERALELQNVNLTEAEKANIRERYRQEEQQLVAQHNMQLAATIIGAYGQAFNAIAGIFQADLNNRTQKENENYQDEISKLDAKKEKKLITDKQYSIEKKKLDDKHAAEEKKLKKEQFEITRAENLSKATMELANSILRASPNPYAMAFAGAVGSAQIAQILMTEAPAYADGGFTDSKMGIKDAGPGILARINEKGKEYITPNWQLQDPVAANLVDYLDYRRQNKIVGYETGGYTAVSSTAPASPMPAGNAELVSVLRNIDGTLKQLPKLIEQTNLVLDFNHEHANEVQKKLDENQQSKQNALL